MDIFSEQLVTIKKTKKNLVLKIIIWVLAVLISALSFYFAVKYFPLIAFVGLGLLYFAYKATTGMNIEYEYISTNGTVDIDKIINKADRKRVISFECKDVFGVEKYNPQKEYDKNYKPKICTDNFDTAYVFFVNTERGREMIIFSPNEKLIESFKRYIPRSIIGR